MKRSELKALVETAALLALAFSPVYISTFVIGRTNSAAARGIPVWADVVYFAIAPFVWILGSQIAGIFAKILGATLLQGRRGSRYLGEVLEAFFTVLLLAVLECVYFSKFFAAFAAAALACLLYKAAEPVCYRLFPSLREPISKKD